MAHSIETVLRRVAYTSFRWSDEDMILSLAAAAEGERGLTTRQGAAAIRILQKMLADMKAGRSEPPWNLPITDMEKALEAQIWDKPLRPSIKREKELRWLGGADFAFRGVYIPSLTDESLKFVYRDELWVTTVTNEIQFLKLLAIIRSSGAAMDRATENYLAECLAMISDGDQTSYAAPVGEGCALSIRNDPTLFGYVKHLCGATTI